MQSLNGESTSKPVQVLNAVLQATKLMNDAATIGNMLGLSPENSQSSVNKSAIAQLLTSLSGSNSYSPLTAVLDYVSFKFVFEHSPYSVSSFIVKHDPFK